MLQAAIACAKVLLLPCAELKKKKEKKKKRKKICSNKLTERGDQSH